MMGLDLFDGFIVEGVFGFKGFWRRRVGSGSGRESGSQSLGWYGVLFTISRDFSGSG